MDVSFSAEEAVLGAMLIDADTVEAVLGIVRAEDFSSDARRAVFVAIRDLYRAGKPVDALTVVDKAGWSANAERRAFVAELIETTPTAAYAAEHARIVHDDATLRAVHAQADALRLAPTLADCRAPLAAMTEALDAGEAVTARTLGEMLMDFSDRQVSDAAREYIQLGLGELDANSYLERGDVLVLGGAPSDGKTALALQMAWHLAKTHNVGFYSLETRYEKLEDRLVAVGVGLDFERIKKRQLVEADWDAYAAATADASARRLTVIQAAGMTAAQIEASSRARGFDVIVVDYVQLVRPESSRGASRAEQMAGVSMAFHGFAQRTQTFVVLLSQLARQERGTKRERDMFDLSESAQFERDADMVLLLSRPVTGKKYSFRGEPAAELDTESTRILRVAKQKEGRRVAFPLYFDGAHQRFAPLVPDDRAALRHYAAEGRAAKDRARADARQIRLDEITGEEEMPF